MTIQVQEVELCKLNVQYVAPEDKVQEARSKVLDRIRREKVPVKGYRPGTAPNHVIEFTMKSTIDSLAAKDLVSEAYNDLLFEHKIKTMFYPKVQNQSFEGGKFHCEMTVWKKPDVELGEYKNFSIPKPALESVSDVSAKMVQELRVRQGETRPYDENDFVQSGDKLTLDMKAECEGHVVEELTQEGFVYSVGQFSELDENLIGMKPDETKSFQVLMKSDAPVESIRNKTVNFTATLHMGMKTDLAPLNDEFAQRLGFQTYSQFESHVNSVAGMQLKNKEKGLLNNQIFSRLLEHNKVNVPSWLAELEAQNMAKSKGAEWKDLSSDFRAKVLVESEKAVKLSLILDAIRETEPDTSFSERELLDALRMKVSETGNNPDEFISNASKDGSIFGIIANMKDAATVDWIIKNSTIVD